MISLATIKKRLVYKKSFVTKELIFSQELTYFKAFGR